MRTLALVIGLVAIAAVIVTGWLLIGNAPPAITRDLQEASRINLTRIGLAFHQHSAMHDDQLAGNITSNDGKPLLSWRVAILPYVDEEKLYSQFKLDEPWDSVANRPLIEKMPKVYTPVGVNGKVGETFYQTFTGPGTVFDPTPQYTIHSIPDHSVHTGLVFEAGNSVIWTQPIDLLFDETKSLPKLGGMFGGDSLVVFFDASVHRLTKDTDERELKKLIMPADGKISDCAILYR